MVSRCASRSMPVPYRRLINGQLRQRVPGLSVWCLHPQRRGDEPEQGAEQHDLFDRIKAWQGSAPVQAGWYGD